MAAGNEFKAQNWRARGFSGRAGLADDIKYVGISCNRQNKETAKLAENDKITRPASDFRAVESERSGDRTPERESAK
jgi:hypothetical protein